MMAPRSPPSAKPAGIRIRRLAARSVLLAPLAWRQPQAMRRQARDHWRAALLVGVLSPLAYALVLFALQIAPLSYVAPVREVSMLLASVGCVATNPSMLASVSSTVR